MKEEIDEVLFRHLVELAALELTDEEALYLRAQLNQQLAVIHEMDAIPVEGNVPISAHGVPYTSENSAPIRLDDYSPKPALDLSKIAPQFRDGYIIVPETPHTNL